MMSISIPQSQVQSYPGIWQKNWHLTRKLSSTCSGSPQPLLRQNNSWQNSHPYLTARSTPCLVRNITYHSWTMLAHSALPYHTPSLWLLSFRLTTHQIHEENAITSLPHPYYTLSQQRLNQPQISLYLHGCLTHRGPPHSQTASHPTGTWILSLLLKKNNWSKLRWKLIQSKTT